MSYLTRLTCHAVHTMSPEAREALAQELYAVHVQIFGGTDYGAFREYVVERPSWRTWIWVKRNPAGGIVGYHATHAFQLDLQGRPSTVIRMEAGTLKAARGRDLTMVYNIVQLLRLWLAAPWRRWCIFAALTHPSSYTFLAHYAPVIWPHVGLETPPKVQQQMEALAEAFGLQRVDPANPLLRDVHWITLETEEERQRWRTSRRADTRFYIQANPGYQQGHGLVTLIPVTGPILVRALSRFLVGRAGRLYRLAVGGQPHHVRTRGHGEVDFQPSRH